MTRQELDLLVQNEELKAITKLVEFYADPKQPPVVTRVVCGQENIALYSYKEQRLSFMANSEIFNVHLLHEAQEIIDAIAPRLIQLNAIRQAIDNRIETKHKEIRRREIIS